MRIPPAAWIFVSCGFVVSLLLADHSGRGVLPAVVCLTECDPGTSAVRRLWPSRDVEPRGKEK